VRLFLAAITVGSAALGYLYLHQPPLPAAEPPHVSQGLFDWEAAGETLDSVATGNRGSTEPPLIVRDAIDETRREITAPLEEFIRDHVPATAPVSDIATQPEVLEAVDVASPVRHEVAADDEELIPFATSDPLPEADPVASAQPAPSAPPSDTMPAQLAEPIPPAVPVATAPVSNQPGRAEASLPTASISPTAKPALQQDDPPADASQAVNQPSAHPAASTAHSKPPVDSPKTTAEGALPSQQKLEPAASVADTAQSGPIAAPVKSMTESVAAVTTTPSVTASAAASAAGPAAEAPSSATTSTVPVAAAAAAATAAPKSSSTAPTASGTTTSGPGTGTAAANSHSDTRGTATAKPDGSVATGRTVNTAIPVTNPSSPTAVATRPKTELLPGNRPIAAEFDRDWRPIGKSTRNVPMHVRRFGRQGHRTLIIAGIDGQDVIGVAWNDLLAEALSQQPELLQSSEILILRAGNPDGLMKRSTFNSRGVLINRNFPSRRYQFLPDQTAGPGPASEAETQVILETLYEFRPRRVIHLTSTSGRSMVISNKAARDLAVSLEERFRLERRLMDPELVPGSLEDFSEGTIDAAVLTLKLSTEGGWKPSWQKHLPVVLAALGGPVSLETVSNDVISPEQGARIQVEEPEPPRKRRLGYEELPKPPH